MSRAVCAGARLHMHGVSRPLALALMCVASTASYGHAQASPLPERVRVSVQRCAALPFDVEAYLAALRVELVALGVVVTEAPPPEDAAPKPATPEPATAANEPIPELSLSSPDCDDRLLLRVQHGALSSDTRLESAELPTLGRERALALVGVERLQRAWPTLSVQPSTAASAQSASQTAQQTPPTTVPEAAQQAPKTPSPPALRATIPAKRSARTPHARGDHHALGQGALSAGLRFSGSAPLASLGLTLDRSFSRTLALGGALAWRSQSENLTDTTDAHSLTAGPRMELALLELGGVALTAAVGLAAGLGWIVTDRAGPSDARISSSPAALGLATGMLGVRALLPFSLFLQTGVVADYALLGARFDTPGGRHLATLTGARFAAFVGAGARLGG